MDARLEQLTPEVLRAILPWPFMFCPFNHFAERGPSFWNGPQNALARIREMRSMLTEQTTEKIEAKRLVKSTSMPERSWQALVLLVILIVVGIGGMAALCYKLEHPAATRMIEDLSHGKIGPF